ncbi:MAG TPA: hypothetical protein VIO11_08790 [Candidatus Methanoperedens sp.]
MATLAFVAEEHACAFDVIHTGEDLMILFDGYIYVTQYFVLEALNNCKPFQTFAIASHGKVCNVKDSEVIQYYLSEERIDIQDNKFVVYNNTFLDEDHPSNKGFEGRDFRCNGRRISFDDYDDIYILSNDEFEVRLVDNYASYSLIRFEFNKTVSPGQRICIRLGYLIEPFSGRKKRFFLYPPELNYYFHFYTKQSLNTEAIQYLNEMSQQNRIMDIRIYSPQRKISTCDFFFITKNEFIEGLSAPSKQTRMPFSKKELADGYLSYHIYPKEMPNLVPITKEIFHNGAIVNTAVLRFDNNSPILLRIYRTDKAIFYSAVSTFLGIFASSNVINIQYTMGLKLFDIIAVSLVLTLSVLVILNRMFAKTKIY